MPEVVWRAGIDLAPLDPAAPGTVDWLTRLVWPGESGREERIRAALRIAASDQPVLVAGDGAQLLASVAARAPKGATLVVQTPGGGGYGDPLQREPALVARDVRRGYYTRAEAERLWAVLLDGEGAPDIAATSAARRCGCSSRPRPSDSPTGAGRRPPEHRGASRTRRTLARDHRCGDPTRSASGRTARPGSARPATSAASSSRPAGAGRPSTRRSPPARPRSARATRPAGTPSSSGTPTRSAGRGAQASRTASPHRAGARSPRWAVS